MNAVNYVSYTFIPVTCDMQLTDDGPYQRSQANGLFTSSVSVTVDVSIDPISRSSSKRHWKRYTQVFPKSGVGSVAVRRFKFTESLRKV